MQTFSVVLLVIAAFAQAQTTPPADACAIRCSRKEVRALSSEQRSKYFNAVRSLMQSGRHDEFTNYHLQYVGQAHGNAAFFPWHRAMLREYEKSLQAVDRDVCLHYWSWDVDSQRPDASPIFTAGYYHSDANGGCVDSDWLGGWRPRYPSSHCLRRAFDASGSMSAFTGPEVLNSIIARSTTYDTFRQRIEGSPHASVHANTGGDMETMHSPNDPLFYAHHTFVDKLWWSWQQVRGDITLYGGPSPSGGEASASNSLTPFDYRVRDVFNITSLCYTYEELQGTAQRMAAQSIQGVADNAPISLENIESVVPIAKFIPAGTNSGTTKIASADAPSTSTQVADTTVAADDKLNLVYLRTPKPIPAEWIAMNNMTEATVRQHEQEYATIVTQLNSIKGYVSPCALLHRPDLLKNDIKAKKSDQYVCPIANKGKLEFKVKSEQDATTILSTIRRAAPEVQGDLNQLRDQVVAVVGEPVMGVESASNFLTTLDEKEKRTPTSTADAHALQSSMAALMVAMVAAYALA